MESKIHLERNLYFKISSAHNSDYLSLEIGDNCYPISRGKAKEIAEAMSAAVRVAEHLRER